MWEKIFKRDQFFAGFVFGVAFPSIFYGALYLVDMMVVKIWNTHMFPQQNYLLILSLAINLFALRYYFVNLTYDKTGRGILIVTFLFALIYFAIF